MRKTGKNLGKSWKAVGQDIGDAVAETVAAIRTGAVDAYEKAEQKLEDLKDEL